jgi:rubrerythrin
VALPVLRGSQYKWLDSGPPESGARELVFRLMTPRQALAIALHAEQRAQAFFEHAYWSAADPAVRALAKEMAAEEREHVALVARELAATPEPGLHSTLIFEK